MEIRKVNPESLRIPTKCYSQGVVVPGGSDMIFVTGQLSQDMDGKIVGEGDIEKQVRVVFSRISDILKEGGFGFDDVVKLGVFVKDIGDAKVVSRVRDEIFQKSRPASTLVEVSGFVKEGCLVEVDCVVVRVEKGK
jgi:3-hydroxyisobutyrate dehydrogenase